MPHFSCPANRGSDSEVRCRTKPELALEILRHQQRIGTRFDWAVADGLYGHDSEFRTGTDTLEIKYMYDAHNGDGVYLECPEISVPERTSAKGRTAVRLKASTQSYKVLSLAKGMEPHGKISISAILPKLFSKPAYGFRRSIPEMGKAIQPGRSFLWYGG